MLKISKLTDYAILILSYLAIHADLVASATAIAQENHLASPTVSKILKMLAEAGLVKSFRGTGGGYQLSRSATEITIAEIVSALEGRLAMTECCVSSNLCALDSLCAVKENWRMINKIILATLASVTLHDMVRPLSEKTLKGIPIAVKGF